MRTFLLTLALVATVCATSQVAHPAAEPTATVVATSDVEWGPLNPARGDKGPKAGDLWGDRTTPGGSGFLVKFVDGFASPPHIHNVAYRAVVIGGRLHNDDPGAGESWLPPGSFWTQPAGQAHVTAAKGTNAMAYVEIEQGPYLVRPTEDAFDTGERPIALDESNIVWLDASTVTWIDQSAFPSAGDGPKVAFLWGDPQDDESYGAFVKLPAGFAGMIRGHGAALRAVVVEGRPTHRMPGEGGLEDLEPGSFFGSKGSSAHRVSCEAGNDCILYVRMEGKFDVVPAEPRN